MADTLREALRDRLGFWPALQWIAVGAVLRHLLDPSPAQFVTTAVSMAVFGLSELVTDVYDVRQSVRHAGFGIYVLISGAALLLLGDSGLVALPVAFLLVGTWFVADAVQTVRHEGATEDVPDGHEVYHDYVARQVHDLLTDRPRTCRELAEELDADDEALDAAVQTLIDRGVVTRVGSELRVAQSTPDGWLARARDRLATVAGRIARPVALEFGREDGEDGDPRESTDDGASASRSAPADEDADREPETAGRR